MSLLLKTVTGGVTRNQPQGNASIDWENPLTKGLVFDMTASVGPINIVKNVMATSTTGMSTLPSTGGLGYKVTQSAGNCIFFSNQTALLNSFPFSLLFIADTVAEANRKFVFQHGQDTGSAAARVWVLFNGTATAGSSSDSSGKLYLYTIDTSLNQNSPAAGGMAGAIISGVHSYGITCDGSTTSYYRDGKLLGTESPTNANSDWTSLGIISVNGVSPNLVNTRPYDRSLVSTRLWNGRLLTERDYLMLAENPWQIYSPRTRDKWITPTIAAGGDVTVTATALSLTLAGQAPVLSGTALVQPTAQALTLSQQAPVVSGNALVQPTALSLSLTQQAPTENGTATVLPSAQSLSLGLQPPSVSTGGAITVNPTALSLSLTVQNPVISGGCTVGTTAQNITISALSPSVTTGGNVTVVLAALSMNLNVQAPVLRGDGVATPTLIQLISTLRAPTVLLNVGVISIERAHDVYIHRSLNESLNTTRSGEFSTSILRR